VFKNRWLPIGAVIALGFSLSFLGKHYTGLERTGRRSLPAGEGRAEEAPRRIVSFAPSITETLFALGLGGRVAGDTRYCDYPPEAAAKPKVGGYLDPNYEALLALRPDLVVLLREQTESARLLGEMSIESLSVDHRNLEGILDSIRRIGAVCGADGRAAVLLNELRARMARIREKTEGRPRPAVMVTLGRNLASGDLKGTFISGTDGYYNDLIELAGGHNAYTGRTISLPTVSPEGLHQLDPQVIVEMIPGLDTTRFDREAFVRSWDFAAGVEAVSRGRVYVFTEEYVVRPGPRFILLAEQLARVIHPEADWGS